MLLLLTLCLVLFMQFSKAPLPIVSVFVLFRSVYPLAFSWLEILL